MGDRNRERGVVVEYEPLWGPTTGPTLASCLAVAVALAAMFLAAAELVEATGVGMLRSILIGGG